MANNHRENLVTEGGCHCRAIRFQVIIDRWKVQDCNCSICQKKGFIHLILPPENFRLLQGQEFLSIYTFNTKVAKHNFCRVCGIHSFYSPRSHPGWIDVNVRCLDIDLSERFDIELFDGRNWEAHVSQIRNNN